MSGEKERESLLLHAALDGELDARGMIDIERTLDADPELKHAYARLESLRQTIHVHAPRDKAPEGLRARMSATVTEAAQAPAPKVRRCERPSWRDFAAAIAATFVVTIGVDRLIATQATTDQTVVAVVAGHMRGQISGQPVDVLSSDRHTVKPWLAHKLPMATMVVDLGPQGFELAGGRIDIVAGAPAPTLVYKRREHLISVSELRLDIAAFSTTPLSKTIDGYSVLVWRDKAHAYVAVSDIGLADLDAFSTAFREAATKESEKK